MSNGPTHHDRHDTDRAVAALIGRRLGRFRVLRLLGAGSMAHVLEADDVTLQRRVALKVLPYDKDADPHRRAAQSQFLREARAAANVVHPAIVQVYEVGLADGFLFIAMELLEAGNLQGLVDEQGPPDWRRVVALGRRAADALAAAHRAGVLHRDIKPANLMFPDDRRVKLADFGLAQRIGDAFELPWKVVGTPRYMAPENASGCYSEASDLFSLGATLWFSLAGSPPFEIEKLAHVAEVQRERRLPDLALRMPHVPCDLWVALETAMAREPGDRFDHARAFADALRAIDTSPSRPARRRPRPRPVTPRWPFAAAPVVLAVLVGLVFWLSRPDSPPTSSPASEPEVAVDAPAPPVIEPEPAAVEPPVVDETPVAMPVEVEPIVDNPPPVEQTPVVLEVEPIDATDRDALVRAAEIGEAVRVRGRVVSMDYRLDTSPKRAELVFVDADLRVIIESRFFGAMTVKFGGTRGSGIVGREVVVTGKLVPADERFRITPPSTRAIESLSAPDPAIAQRYTESLETEAEEQADVEAIAPRDEPPIESTDTQALRQLIAQNDKEPVTIAGRVVGKPAIRGDGTLVIRLNSQVGLIVVCDRSMRAAIEKRFGSRASSLAGRSVSVRGILEVESGRAPQLRPASADDLGLIRP